MEQNTPSSWRQAVPTPRLYETVHEALPCLVVAYRRQINEKSLRELSGGLVPHPDVLFSCDWLVMGEHFSNGEERAARLRGQASPPARWLRARRCMVSMPPSQRRDDGSAGGGPSRNRPSQTPPAAHRGSGGKEEQAPLPMGTAAIAWWRSWCA